MPPTLSLTEFTFGSARLDSAVPSPLRAICKEISSKSGSGFHPRNTAGLALAQLAPGPLAAQLAIYLGWVRGGVLGATLVGVAFVVPSFLMVLALAAFYLKLGGLPWMQGMFYGIGAAVIAIIGRSAYKLVRSTLSKDWLLWTIFAVSALVTAWTESEVI